MAYARLVLDFAFASKTSAIVAKLFLRF